MTPIMSGILTVSIPTALGYFTNVIAIGLLTKPHKAILGIQGLIPKKKGEFAQAVAETIAEKLINAKTIAAQIPEEALRKYAQDSIVEVLSTYLGGDDDALKQSPEALEALQGIVADVLKSINVAFPESLISKESITRSIASQINHMPIVEIEDMINTVASTQFRFIELTGAALGFIIGLLQLFIL